MSDSNLTKILNYAEKVSDKITANNTLKTKQVKIGGNNNDNGGGNNNVIHGDDKKESKE